MADQAENRDKQLAKLLDEAGVDNVVHGTDPKKAGLSTLCGKQTSLVKTSMKDVDINCPECRGILNRIAALGF